MAREDKLYKIWVYLQAEPLFWITLTLGAYLVGDYLYKKSKLNPLVNPVAISILIVSSVLLFLDVSYDRYFEGAKFIHFILGPATVALAIPIYEKRKAFLTQFIPIFQSQHQAISGGNESVTIDYSSGMDHAPLEDLLVQNLSKDRALQYTSVGIHKDDLQFELEGHPIKNSEVRDNRNPF